MSREEKAAADWMWLRLSAKEVRTARKKIKNSRRKAVNKCLDQWRRRRPLSHSEDKSWDIVNRKKHERPSAMRRTGPGGKRPKKKRGLGPRSPGVEADSFPRSTGLQRWGLSADVCSISVGSVSIPSELHPHSHLAGGVKCRCLQHMGSTFI